VEPDQKMAEFPLSCAQLRGKVFVQTSGTDGKHILRRGAFWGSQPNRY